MRAKIKRETPARQSSEEGDTHACYDQARDTGETAAQHWMQP